MPQPLTRPVNVPPRPALVSRAHRCTPWPLGRRLDLSPRPAGPRGARATHTVRGSGAGRVRCPARDLCPMRIAADRTFGAAVRTGDAAAPNTSVLPRTPSRRPRRSAMASTNVTSRALHDVGPRGLVRRHAGQRGRAQRRNAGAGEVEFTAWRDPTAESLEPDEQQCEQVTTRCRRGGRVCAPGPGLPGA